ncbi:MAG: hypothetical protein EOP46_15015 [Sphingobacteriaceae bacterium]|nr:MAG: hypothetical protein EOP46_15015 [Sphingobacteriaceae bacterium]
MLFLHPDMKAVVVILLSLCFLLLKGHDHAFARGHHSKNTYLLAREIEKTQRFATVKYSKPGDIPESFISIESETEDFAFARKYVLIAQYFLTLALIPVLCNLYTRFKNGLLFGRHLSHFTSYKLILQGVLRI